uniref:Uncharacterized protein n=1 Tax=Arundo donax TaxID=35708 RepID=A0A0A9HTS0_ARUDO
MGSGSEPRRAGGEEGPAAPVAASAGLRWMLPAPPCSASEGFILLNTLQSTQSSFGGVLGVSRRNSCMTQPVLCPLGARPR